jgi:GNAT superfamily N-acetyltransferase
VDLTWLDRDRPDQRDIAGAVAVIEGARLVDSPHWLPGTACRLTASLRHGWDGDPPDIAVHRDGSGRVVAVLEVSLPAWDNTHLGFVEVTVDPLLRRQGIGRRLFEAGVDRVRSSGRDLLLSSSFFDTAGAAFLEEMGLKRATEEAERRLGPLTLDGMRLEQEYVAAQRRAEVYELVRMPDRVPDELMADVVRMTTSINDAPTGDLEVEDEVFSPERIRAFETAQLAAGRRLYRLAARERATGELVGHTLVAVEGEQPWWAWQYDTTVVPAHRGHRLGLLLKIAMLGWLREEEPQLRTIDTWNATSNRHMVRVNEVLGCRVVAYGGEWQVRL